MERHGASESKKKKKGAALLDVGRIVVSWPWKLMSSWGLWVMALTLLPLRLL